MYMSFSLIGFLYIIVAGALCYILPIPEIVKGFLALPGFLIIPYLVGDLFIFKKNITNNQEIYADISKFIIIWMLGLIFLTLGAMVLKSITLFAIHYYIVFIFIAIGIKRLYERYNKKYLSIYPLYISAFIKTNYKIISAIILIILLPLTLEISPFPTIDGGDIFFFSNDVHQTVSASVFFQYGTYFSYLSLSVSILSIIFNLHSFTLFWTGTFFLFFCFCFGIYLLSYRIFKNMTLSLIVVIFTVFSTSFYGPRLTAFVPHMWLYAMTPFSIFVINEILHKGIYNKIKFKDLTKLILIFLIISLLIYKIWIELIADLSPNYEILKFFLYYILNWGLMIALLRFMFNTKDSIIIGTVFAFLIFLHHPESLLIIPLLIIFIFLHFLSKYSASYCRVINYILILSIVIAIIFQIPLYIHIVSIFSGNFYNFTYSEKINLLINAISYFNVFVFVIGAFGVIFIKRNINYLSFITISLIALFIYLINIDILVRNIVFVVLFSAFISSYGFLFVRDIFCSLYPKKRFIVTMILFLIMTVCILAPHMDYLNNVHSIGGKTLATFTNEEYKSALWIEKNIPDGLIISDWWTQLIFSGLSGVQNVGDPIFVPQFISTKIIASDDPIEAYKLSNVFLQDFSKKETDIFFNNFLNVTLERGFEINLTKKKPLIIITSRTVRCMKVGAGLDNKNRFELLRFITDDAVDINSPNIKKFFNSTYFTLLYKDNNIYIFGVNPEPGVPFKIQNNTK